MNTLKDIFQKSKYILDDTQKRRLFRLIFIQIGDTLMELLGVISIYPFISLVLSPQIIETNKLLNWLYNVSGVTTNEVFFLLVALLIILLYLIKNAYNAFTGYSCFKFIYGSRREVSTKLMRGYMDRPYSFFIENNSSVLMRGVSTDVSQYFDMVRQMIFVCADIVLVAVFGAYLLYTDWVLSSIIILLMFAFVFLFVKQNKKRASKCGKENRIAAAKMVQWLQQSFGGIKEIKILHREKYFTDNFDEYNKISNDTQKTFSFLNLLPHLILECFCSSAILLVIAVRIILGADPNTFVPKMAVFAVALFRMFPRVSRINTGVNSVIFARPSVIALYNDFKLVNSSDVEEIQADDTSKIEFNKELQLKDVSFAYPNTEKNIFTNMNLTIEKGQAIGLVGPSGAGKTTLVDILLGILEVGSGQVLCDGTDIRSDKRSWSKLLGYIPQNIFLSDDTIRNNITFGLPTDEATDERVWSALEQAKLKEYVENLPKGLDTEIGERGVRLSGGQRQRIGIARALYTNPEILVLDEATSALDNETEIAVMESIEHLLGHKTMIIIAHRITTVRNCNAIYNIENGLAVPIEYDSLIEKSNSKQE